MRWNEQQLQEYQNRKSILQTAAGTDRTIAVVHNTSSKILYVPYEHQEQVAFVQWLRSQDIRHNATPNGGFRAAKTAKYLKAEGVSAGFPDITVWPAIGSGLPILYIEMKRSKGGVATDDQLEWQKYLSCLPNTKAVICSGAVEAIRFVVDTWGLSPRKEFDLCVREKGLSKVVN
ncbi:VRR-NUC domain-containing protein (plasmid) [Trichlorobacter lovleyi]|uniref:VRR-NUC domain-containing protein n=1 Tax=Trichlorobacter lovleyi TaxID=313985 RepID=UPI002240A71F|nr:VRR-NUC domain-containing protein [Trichlorobacter lovleyi]QOX80791.1 VRR-NUC domain-containing protein [Trichlorobacter lovleyi]